MRDEEQKYFKVRCPELGKAFPKNHWSYESTAIIPYKEILHRKQWSWDEKLYTWKTNNSLKYNVSFISFQAFSCSCRKLTTHKITFYVQTCSLVGVFNTRFKSTFNGEHMPCMCHLADPEPETAQYPPN